MLINFVEVKIIKSNNKLNDIKIHLYYRKKYILILIYIIKNVN